MFLANSLKHYAGLYARNIYILMKEKVDLAANQLRQNLGLYDHFLERMDKWLFQNRRKVLSVMKKFDRDQEGLVTYDEFKSGISLYKKLGLIIIKTEKSTLESIFYCVICLHPFRRVGQTTLSCVIL